MTLEEVGPARSPKRALTCTSMTRPRELAATRTVADRAARVFGTMRSVALSRVSKQAAPTYATRSMRYERCSLRIARRRSELQTELAGEDPVFGEEVAANPGSARRQARCPSRWKVLVLRALRFRWRLHPHRPAPANGGLEAQDWTEMLYRHVFSRYADSKGWKVKVLDLVPGAEAVGLRPVQACRSRGALRTACCAARSGVHRLVRISPDRRQEAPSHHVRRGRGASRFSPITIFPWQTSIPNDVRVDVYRASGPGGQCVNTTDSAVRLDAHAHGHRGHVPKREVPAAEQGCGHPGASRSKSVRDRSNRNAASQTRQSCGASAWRTRFGSQIRNYVLYPVSAGQGCAQRSGNGQRGRGAQR